MENFHNLKKTFFYVLYFWVFFFNEEIFIILDSVKKGITFAYVATKGVFFVMPYLLKAL